MHVIGLEEAYIILYIKDLHCQNVIYVCKILKQQIITGMCLDVMLDELNLQCLLQLHIKNVCHVLVKWFALCKDYNFFAMFLWLQLC